MIDFPHPQPLVNPICQTVPLSGWELLAGPLGVMAFLPLIPLIKSFAAQKLRGQEPPRASIPRIRIALIASCIIWLLATTGPLPAAIMIAGLLAAVGWIVLLGRLRDKNTLGRRAMIAAVWIGLHALVLPLWWVAYPHWYHSRMAVLHAMGFSYLLLRLIGWGVDWANRPQLPLRLGDTLAWLAYVPCMRAGPLMQRSQFLERLDAWDSYRPAISRIAAKLAAGLAGLGLLTLIWKNTPHVQAGNPDFFAAPELYTTRHLMRLLYLIPTQIYLFLWSYNEIAIGLSMWLGVPADENFHRLPLATSVRDFWRRWHITLGAWLREYIYIPLGGNRGFLGLGRALTPLNHLAVFGYVAIWHGACWAFVVWALLQVAALTLHTAWDALRDWLGWSNRPNNRLWTATCWFLTINYQCVTILLLADFEYAGSRILPEIARRLLGAPGPA